MSVKAEDPVGERHYEQELNRSLGTLGNAMLTLSAMSPATTVFVYVPVIYFVAGSSRRSLRRSSPVSSPSGWPWSTRSLAQPSHSPEASMR